MNLIERNTEIMEEYEAKYQDFLKSQEVGHSASFWLSELLYSLLRLVCSFSLYLQDHIPNLMKALGSQQRQQSEKGTGDFFILRVHINHRPD